MIKINKSFFRFELKEDRAILLACMGVALIFWLLIKLSQTYRAQKSVGFDIELPEGTTLSTLPPDNLVADLEGTGWDLLFDHFYGGPLTLTYEMQSTGRLQLTRGQLRNDIKQKLYSDDIKILEVNYDQFNFQAEEQAANRVPLLARTDLSFAPEHQLKKPVELTPDSVTLLGPASLVNQFDRWHTDSLQFSGLKQSTAISVKVESPPKEIAVSPRQVTANLEVEPFTEKSVYVPIVVKNAPDSLRIFPEKVTVTSRLGLSQYDRISYRDFTAEVDLQGVTSNSSGTTAPIVITRQPAYIESLYYTPKSAKFFIVDTVATDTAATRE